MSEQTEREARTDYWQKQIEAWRASGQSQMAYCKTNDLNYSQFVYWRRKFRQAGQTVRRGRSTGFIPATCVGAKTAEVLAVVLPNGVERRGVNADNLAVAEQLLSRWS